MGVSIRGTGSLSCRAEAPTTATSSPVPPKFPGFSMQAARKCRFAPLTSSIFLLKSQNCWNCWSGNLLLSNFNAADGFDTDDNSAYFHMKDNVPFYGHFLKSDYSGHSIEF